MRLIKMLSISFEMLSIFINRYDNSRTLKEYIKCGNRVLLVRNKRYATPQQEDRHRKQPPDRNNQQR